MTFLDENPEIELKTEKRLKVHQDCANKHSFLQLPKVDFNFIEIQAFEETFQITKLLQDFQELDFEPTNLPFSLVYCGVIIF